jgi:hypothetical protein
MMVGDSMVCGNFRWIGNNNDATFYVRAGAVRSKLHRRAVACSERIQGRNSEGRWE